MATTLEGFDPDQAFDASTPSLYPAASVMAEPAHPGDLMREIIEGYGLTVTGAAKAAGLQRTHLSAMLTGEKPVSIETAIKFEAAFGGPAPTVIHGMSDLHESAKALRSRDELVGNIVRVKRALDELQTAKPKRRVKEEA